MTERLILAQHHLYTFYACQRRFYLRFLAHVPWPEPPLASETESAYELGRRFHRWAERFFLGLPVESSAAADPVIRNWWSTFERQRPIIPEGKRFVEFSLTVPVGDHFLTGRFDLLVITESGESGRLALIYDWKTGEPRPIDRLQQAWQTRVYLGVLAESGNAFLPDGLPRIASDRLKIIYWYIEDPTNPREILYDSSQHERNWADLAGIVTEIDRQLTANNWPLTDDWSECRRCPYQAYCGRQAAGGASPALVDEDGTEPDEHWLEPQWQ